MSVPSPASTVTGVGVRRPSRGPLERWPRATDLAVVLVSFVLTLMLWAQRAESGSLPMDTWFEVGAFLLAFVASLALLWRRTHPLLVHAVVLTASVIVYAGPTADGIVALAFSLYCLGRYEANSRASLAGALAALLVLMIEMRVITEANAGNTITAMMTMGIWYAGRRLRFRGEYLRLLEERALHLERERNAEAERAVAAERTRIAREMHDVVAHQVSLMTVQAGAARTVSASDPEAAGDAMAAVESAGRHALKEMRHLLGVLRPANAAGELDPQPGIDDLPALVTQVNDVGPEVRLETSGALSGLPARVELNAYRIVQEALTNVIKHAGADVHVDVSVARRNDGVAIRVADDGAGGGSGHGGGHGLVGMRERVELLGGTFHAGPRAGGGFEVGALLPIDSEAP